MKQQDSPAVAIARDHIEAWSNHDWNKAREMLAPDVFIMTMSPQSTEDSVHLEGIDEYMEGLIRFAQAVEPGSARVITSEGDQHNAVILVAVKADFGQGKVTLQSARLYLLDENQKIKVEQAGAFVLPD